MINDAGGIGHQSSKFRAIARQISALATDPNFDPEDLALFLELRVHLADAEVYAVRRLRTHGFSWTYLATFMNMSRQALQKRYPSVR